MVDTSGQVRHPPCSKKLFVQQHSSDVFNSECDIKKCHSRSTALLPIGERRGRLAEKGKAPADQAAGLSPPSTQSLQQSY